MFLLQGGTIHCRVIAPMLYSSDLPQRGLEIACMLTFEGGERDLSRLVRNALTSCLEVATKDEPPKKKMKLDSNDYFDVKEEFRLYFIKVLNSSLRFCAGTAFHIPYTTQEMLAPVLGQNDMSTIGCKEVAVFDFTIPSTQANAITVLTAAPFTQRAVNYARTSFHLR